MAYSTAERFASKHGGFKELARFIEYIREGCPDCRHLRRKCVLTHLAHEFELSIGEVCLLRGKLMEKSWNCKRGLKEYMARHIDNAEFEIQSHRATILRLANDEPRRA